MLHARRGRGDGLHAAVAGKEAAEATVALLGGVIIMNVYFIILDYIDGQLRLHY